MKELKGLVSKEQIEAWKNQYGAVNEITANGKVCYLKNADRRLVSMLYSMENKDEVAANEAILNNCWLGGCEDFKTNDNDFLSAMNQFGNVLIYGESSIKKY